jgi:ligand-binding sensor domain-containing protein
LFCNTFHNHCFKQIRWLWIFLAYFCLVPGTNKLAAQSYPFREYSVLDGLPQSQVTYLMRDSKGFIWIGTRNGLSRFDGIEFVNYFRKDGLPSNLVLNIFEDLNGNIWALSKEGISRYNGLGFDRFFLPPELEGWSFSIVSKVNSDNSFFLLGICPGDTLRRLVIFKNGIYSDYARSFPALDTINVREFWLDRSQNELIMINNHEQIMLWFNNKLTVLSKKTPGNAHYFKNALTVNSNDTLLIYKNRKFELYNFKTTPGISDVNLKSTLLNSEFEFYDGRNNYKIELPFNYTSYVFDDENVLWFSSEGNLYRLLSTAFREFSQEDIGSRNFWTLAEDRNGHIWFGSLYNTLIEYDGKVFRERNEFKSLFRKNVSFYKGSRRMSNGDNWFSTNLGIIIWDGSSFSRLKGIPDDTQICYIYEDPDNKTVMIGSEKGLFIIKDGKVKLIPDFNDKNLGVIEGITKDDSGFYWLSGHMGVLRFDGMNPVPVKESILPLEYTYTIIKDPVGGIWVTSDEGLYFKGKASENFIAGLPESINRSANSIILVDRNHILVGRVSDICLIDLDKFYKNEKNYFRIYDSSDGFMGSDCLDNGIIKDLHGRFWILTSNNVVIFDPEQLKQNPTPPKVHIIRFDYETDSIGWQPVDKLNYFRRIPDNTKLKRFQNNIQIAFTGISTTNPEKVRMQYRLEGYEEKWSLPSNKRFINYEKLSPGSYRFQVKAFNADGVETPEPLTMEFRVLPSFWQTTIFAVMTFILCISLIVITTLLIMRRRQRKHEEKILLRSELSRLQMGSVLKQFDPHFTFNVISSVGSLVMKGDKETAYECITKLSALLRTVLSDGSVIIKPLVDEIDFVRRYCELQKLRFKDRFNFSIVIDTKADLQRDIPKMTIQNFVENAIKHGIENRKEGGRVEIAVCSRDNILEIKITDNGIGRAAASRQMTSGTGYGLKIIEGLFEVMNEYNNEISTIEIEDLEENGKVSGTEVKIIIPDDFKFEFRKARTK